MADVRMVNSNTGAVKMMPPGVANSAFPERDGWYIEDENYTGPKPNRWGKQLAPKPVNSELDNANKRIEELLTWNAEQAAERDIEIKSLKLEIIALQDEKKDLLAEIESLKQHIKTVSETFGANSPGTERKKPGPKKK